MLFLSTPSARRATVHPASLGAVQAISIHALREEGDEAGYVTFTDRSVFLSTPSARRATGHAGRFGQGANISIHALREEGDFLFSAFVVEQKHFYPRPPRGGRLPSRSISLNDYIFLSTPSARRATVEVETCNAAAVISIHALREEGDWSSTSRYSTR